MIELKNVSKKFDGKEVLKDITLTINDGEFVVILGKSGSGKTTLLNIMGMLEKSDTGSVLVDGKSYSSKKDKTDFYRNSSGYLFQNFALIENDTVENNLNIGLAYSNLSKEQKHEKIENVLNVLNLKDMMNKKIYQLSGGEQQRVALGRIMLKNSKFIYADEPTGNLDEENKLIVFKYLNEFKNEGKTVIVVTHDRSLTDYEFVDKVIQL